MLKIAIVQLCNCSCNHECYNDCNRGITIAIMNATFNAQKKASQFIICNVQIFNDFSIANRGKR